MTDLDFYLMQKYQPLFKYDKDNDNIDEIYKTEYGFSVIIKNNNDYYYQYDKIKNEENSIDVYNLLYIFNKLKNNSYLVKIKPKIIKRLELILGINANRFIELLGGWYFECSDFNIIYDQFGILYRSKAVNKKFSIKYKNTQYKDSPLILTYDELISNLKEYTKFKKNLNKILN